MIFCEEIKNLLWQYGWDWKSGGRATTLQKLVGLF